MEKGSVTRKLTIREFFKRFPDEATCLEHVMDVRFGLEHTCRKCGQHATFHRLENRKAYACARCGDNVYPCAQTIFQDTRTPLQVWFYAIYIFSVSRNGVGAMELHRALGVTYKCAHRMGHQIRKLMGKANEAAGEKLTGIVEADEVFMGGVVRGQGSGVHAEKKAIVIGLKERGGRLVTKVVPDLTAQHVRPMFDEHVSKHATVHTDESRIYDLLGGAGWDRRAVNHSAKQYARPDFLRGGESIHVNGLENFWAHLQASVRGTHIHISKQHAQKYVDEFTYRANQRELGNVMFDALIAAL